ncbi:MAG TPA: hypothetical protein VH277_02655 [Gemmatimonadaceae bacterium]|nr:hypothetical protein [Gemmatimonadaceae bacterium]
MAALLSLAPFGAPARAQQWTGSPAADSATAARAAWARASGALRAGLEDSARAEIARAATAWPTQPAYVWASVRLAARAHDTVAALDWLRTYANLGLGHELSSDTTVARLIGLPAFAKARDAIAANARPLVRSRRLLAFGDSSFWAEGVDADPRTGHFFVSSIRHRTIADVARDGTARELWPRDRAGLGAIFGVRVDTIRNVLWATTSGVPQEEGYVPGDSGVAALLEIRPADGSILRRWDLPAAPMGHVLGDLAVGPRGDVFMTDSNHPTLYRLRSESDTLESITSPLFHSLQGLAPTPDGRTLYLTDYSHGLLRVDLQSAAVKRVADAAGSTSLDCDGIVWYRGGIVAVQNGVTPRRIVRFVLDATGDRIERVDVVDRNVVVADEPTIGTIAGNEFVYVANGQWDKHDDMGRRVPHTELRPTILLAVPLPH